MTSTCYVLVEDRMHRKYHYQFSRNKFMCHADWNRDWFDGISQVTRSIQSKHLKMYESQISSNRFTIYCLQLQILSIFLFICIQKMSRKKEYVARKCNTNLINCSSMPCHIRKQKFDFLLNF